MCGIAGIYRFSGDGDDDATVAAMTARLLRRGPDDGGVLRDGPVTLGNRRLAILDLSPAGHQPMASADGRLVITFNGEIYNHRELAVELGLGPGDLRSHADTEVLLHAWARWGEGMLERLVGQWAFALHDRATGCLWLARDRFGEKPLYYHRSRDALALASSTQALLAAPWVPRELDPDALVEYLTIRYVLAPRTVLAGVEKLPPGHLMRVGADGVSTRCWYAPRFRVRSETARRRPADLVAEFDALFTRAVRRCLVADVPVALFLSDGIDSNAIHHVLARDGGAVPAYTFAPVAAAGAPFTGEPLPAGATPVPVPIDERVEKMVPALASLTEPVGDGAALATWLLVRGARERATVFLCGHGGDEVLGGYRLSYDRFRLALLHGLSWLPAGWFEGEAARYLHGDEPFAVRWRRLRDATRSHAPDAARHLIHKPLPAADLHELYGDAPPPAPYLAGVAALYAASEGACDLDRMQEVLLHTFLSANLLSWADAVAMDSSAELRMPYLDRDLVEFVLGLPPGWRVPRRPGSANTKVILRRWARGRLDPAVIDRGKRGFPFGNLPALMASDGPTLRARILDVAPLRRLLPGVENWLAHPPEYYREPWESTLWALLALGIWCDAAGVR